MSHSMYAIADDAHHFTLQSSIPARTDGSVYTGEWKEGKYNGLGGKFLLFWSLIFVNTKLITLTNTTFPTECRWADGRVYKGEWVMGKAHGYGSTYYCYCLCV